MMSWMDLIVEEMLMGLFAYGGDLIIRVKKLSGYAVANPTYAAVFTNRLLISMFIVTSFV